MNPKCNEAHELCKVMFRHPGRIDRREIIVDLYYCPTCEKFFKEEVIKTINPKGFVI